MPVLIVYNLSQEQSRAFRTKHKDARTAVETWRHKGIVLHADGEPSARARVRSVAAARDHGTLPRHRVAHSHQSQGQVEACIGVYRVTFSAIKLQLEANSVANSMSLRQPCLSWLARHVAWLMTRYNTDPDGMSPNRPLYGKQYRGFVCIFGALDRKHTVKQNRTSLGTLGVTGKAGVDR